jgi:hypothetical protein
VTKRPFLTGARLAKSDLSLENTKIDNKAKIDTHNKNLSPFEKIWEPNKLTGDENNGILKISVEGEEPKNKSLPKLGHAREFIFNLDFENDIEMDNLSDSKLDEKSNNRKKTLGGKFENRITSVKLV